MYMEIGKAGEDKVPAVVPVGKIPVLSGQRREKARGFSPDADKIAVFQRFKLSGRFTVNNIPFQYKIPLSHFFPVSLQFPFFLRYVIIIWTECKKMQIELRGLMMSSAMGVLMGRLLP
jgi:hypothetical protein